MKHLTLFIGFLLIIQGCSEGQGARNKVAIDKTDSRKIEENTIINLYDAFGENKEGLIKDFGFSCIVTFNGKTILFDSGTNADIFKNNVKTLNIDLTEIDIAVASHAHFDHINGFDYLLKVNPDVKLYFPFDFFWGADIPFDLSGADPSVTDSLEQRMQYFGGDYSKYHFNQTGRFWNANIEFIKESKEIEPGIRLITTSSSNMGYFNKYPSLDACENCESPNAKYNGLQEISLSLESDKGEILFVGCSHSTVEKIITGAKEVTKNDIAMVYGGFHLLPYDRKTLTDLASRLKDDHKISKVAPAHCTGHLAFKILQDNFKEDYVFAGLGEEVKF